MEGERGGVRHAADRPWSGNGYLIEVGQSTGLLHGQRAAKRPEDLPG